MENQKTYYVCDCPMWNINGVQTVSSTVGMCPHCGAALKPIFSQGVEIIEGEKLGEMNHLKEQDTER